MGFFYAGPVMLPIGEPEPAVALEEGDLTGAGAATDQSPLWRWMSVS
ncbi:MAG: hypothetical protein M2R45_00629 [Verrucomicrobia subdivision 3 bacterium]|nr:hypothetical protein [Limisphaerales bacterium]MCS1414488.1 hypothetical protein [Limisphaerales bacterium]